MSRETLPADQPIYQHPLAYLLGLEGIALFRAFSGEYDEDFTLARIAETRRLLDSADELGADGFAAPISAADGYDSWAPSYDEPGNGLIDAEQPIVWDILNSLPVGTAVDAASGTGRHAAHLVELGHHVIGVDSSPGMLTVARQKLPEVTFHLAELHQIPTPDDYADVVVCALALTHVRDLTVALAEFVRILKPGGHLGLSDSRGLMSGARRYPVVQVGPDDRPGYLPNWIHQTGDYLRAALPLGLHLRACIEPVHEADYVDRTGRPPNGPPLPAHTPSDRPPNIWTLHPFAPTATNASYRDTPHLIVWHFQLAG